MNVPPRRSGMSPVASILLVVAIVAIVGAGAVLAGYLWLRREVTRKLYEVLDSGEIVFTDGGPPVLLSPPAVKAALAGPKKDYVGSWTGKGSDATLDVGSDGSLRFEKKDERGQEKLDAMIVAFAGDDMEVGLVVAKIRVRVTSPPKRVGDHWEMTADGVDLERP